MAKAKTAENALASVAQPSETGQLLYDPEATDGPADADIIETRDTDAPTDDVLSAARAAREAAPVDDRQQLIDDIARIRAQRKTFGVQTQKLAIQQRPGYKRYWFNDAPGRIELAELNGWAHVLDKAGNPISRVVGRGAEGTGLRAFAMEIPEVFWNEDQDRIHKRAEAAMDEIKKRPIRAQPGQAQASDKNKFYSPTDGDILEVGTVRGS